ncbi:MAG: flap endonuclease-1, partial [Infirmifilum sp.]
TEWLPSKQRARRLEPELVEMSVVLEKLGISRRQLVEVAILVGTDYNEGVRGVGPKKALKLIRTYGSIERLPESIKKSIPDYEDVLNIFMKPVVYETYRLEFREPDYEGLEHFLVDENEFSEERVKTLLERLRRAWGKQLQAHLDMF